MFFSSFWRHTHTLSLSLSLSPFFFLFTLSVSYCSLPLSLSLSHTQTHIYTNRWAHASALSESHRCLISSLLVHSTCSQKLNSTWPFIHPSAHHPYTYQLHPDPSPINQSKKPNLLPPAQKMRTLSLSLSLSLSSILKLYCCYSHPILDRVSRKTAEFNHRLTH